MCCTASMSGTCVCPEGCDGALIKYAAVPCRCPPEAKMMVTPSRERALVVLWGGFVSRCIFKV